MLKYKEFVNESSMSDIFSSLHGAIDDSKLIKLSDFIKKPNRLDIDESDLKKASEYLDIPQDYFYYDPSNFMYPVIIWEGPLYYGFMGGNIEIETLKKMRAKEYLEKSKKSIDELVNRKDYGHLFAIMDKRILIPSFIKMYHDIPDEKKYDVFIDLYVRSEYGFGKFPWEIIKDCFSKRFFSPSWKEGMEKFKKIVGDKEKIVVYRGVGSLSSKEDLAFSWTLSKKTAKFFSDRFGGPGKIIKKTISPEEVIDYLDSRGESEIILIPKKYKDQ